MLCRAANICSANVYPFVNMRTTNQDFQRTSSFCLTDTEALIRIMEASTTRLPDFRKYIVAETHLNLTDSNKEFRGKDLLPSAFKRIEIITDNPNTVKFVLNQAEDIESEETYNEEIEQENLLPQTTREISTINCWGDKGWLGVLKKNKEEMRGEQIPSEIASDLASIREALQTKLNLFTILFTNTRGSGGVLSLQLGALKKTG